MEYEAAGKIVTPEMTVLDCACGVGYGSHYLSGLAKNVVGIDCSREAITYAKTAYRAGNLSFIVGDARELPYQNGFFDAFVGIETLEHFSSPDKYLSEIHRVLKPGGLLFLSTPDGDSNPHKGIHAVNDYHWHHYRKDELDMLIGKLFPTYRLTRDGMNGCCYRVTARKKAARR